MARLKISTRFVTSPKIALLSDRAFRVHVSAICWSADYQTAGQIPARALRIFGAGTRAGSVGRELVAAGLWASTKTGDFVITDTAYSIEREPQYGDGQRERIYERDGYRCVECGETDDLTLDHIHPRSRGGSDRDPNLRTLCRSCNSSKGARV
jgi:hypothetical protein